MYLGNLGMLGNYFSRKQDTYPRTRNLSHSTFVTALITQFNRNIIIKVHKYLRTNFFIFTHPNTLNLPKEVGKKVLNQIINLVERMYVEVYV